ncbi:glycosyltransferase [Parabacteroides hominis]|uniref:Glycosyltransferase n=2 Tax=Parabacteroides TaxID=375288 RepID=A0ABR7DNA6_9BACT|nr:glycosyltransferase [Parabacteroides hominis]MBC5632927.1 glycosyltransferase [Parabacteroides hominis]
MSHTPLISVVMPVYNSDCYLHKSIDSILDQTFVDFEFIIINDGSDDNSENIILSYKDERIIYLKNEYNVGNYLARNIGLKMAKGKYVAIMDADDIAFPNRLARQFMYLEEHKDVKAVGSWFIFENNQQQWKHPVEDEQIRLGLLEKNCFMHASLMICSDILYKLNGYNELYRYASDYDLVCRIVFHGKVYNLPEILMVYRCHSTQISQKYMQIQQLLAEKIRLCYQLNFIKFYGRGNLKEVDRYTIGDKKLGYIISLYIYSRFMGDKAIEYQADEYLSSVIDEMCNEVTVKLYNLGCGFIYLLRNGLILGNEDDVLRDIDLQLDWLCLALNVDDKESLLGWIHYLCLRIDIKNGNSLVLLKNKQNLICLLNYLDKFDICEDDSILFKDMRKVHFAGLCPVVTNRLLFVEKNKIEVTFIIPVRIDSKERESNLDWLIERLSRRRNTFILLLEADTESRYLLKAKYENVKYCFVRDNDPVFYRTHYLNQLLRMADTSIVGIWDTDVVLSEKQIEESILTIYENRSALCYPYNGMYCSLSMQGSLLLKEAGISSINSLSSSDILSISTSSVGGAFFVNRNLYLQLGGENEFFYGWGCEDLERYKRLEILCQPVYRVAGPLYHLYHPRKENSWYQNEMLELSNRQEFLKVCGMSCEELKQYVQSWKWISVK